MQTMLCCQAYAGLAGRARPGSDKLALRSETRSTVTTKEHNREAHDRPGSDRTVTMQDIARASGVSQSTVSRVLNDAVTTVPIAADTRERVLEAADRLGYRPNPLARGLRGAKTMLLGIIVREISDPFFAPAVEAVSMRARERSYNVVLGSAHSRADEAIELHAVLETRHCDAIIVLGDMRDQPRLLDDLAASRAPVVALWQGGPLPGVDTVNVDNRAGVVAAVDHLTALGHRRLGFIGASLHGDVRERRAAFVEHLASLGLPPDDEHIVPAVTDPAAGAEAFRRLMSRPDPPSAVVTATDNLAIGVLHAAYSLGLAIPDDISVVGFDDIPLAAYTAPPLTTVHNPIAEMATLAVDLAVERPPARGDDDRHHVLPPGFSVRATTARLAVQAPTR
jgi:DNA-binding LacI/PurR family transcriptional regulator